MKDEKWKSTESSKSGCDEKKLVTVDVNSIIAVVAEKMTVYYRKN